ncbi:hypothetical protein L596_013759 [Steinernema carpocapsae]|uniref:WD repeat domain phosphoinositide-interacting protein 2 n=1 Tax=Steinernema carpocapsae TaxID=34508 RepID=A0A4V6A564_STECR|nr:hypothetical protein L596_013759 [Steinernema carpocapsae]
MYIPSVSINSTGTSLCYGDIDGYFVYSLNDIKQKNFCEKFDQWDPSTELYLAERLNTSKLLLCCSHKDSREVLMIGLKAKQVIMKLDMPSDVLSVRINNESLIICMQHMIRIFIPQTMQAIHTINDIPSNPNGAADLSQTTSMIAYPTFENGGKVVIYDGKNLKAVRVIDAHDGPVVVLKFNKQGTLIATASDKGTVIRVFSVETGVLVHEFQRGVTRFATIYSIAFSEDSQYLACTSNTGTVHLFHLSPRENEPCFPKDSNPISDLVSYLWKSAEAYTPAVVRPKSTSSCVLPVGANSFAACALRIMNNRLHLIVATSEKYLFVYEFDPYKLELSLKSQFELGREEEEKGVGLMNSF